MVGQQRRREKWGNFYIYIIWWCWIFGTTILYCFCNHQANTFVKIKYLQLGQHLAKPLSVVYSFSWVQLSRGNPAVQPHSLPYHTELGCRPQGTVSWFLFLAVPLQPCHCTALQSLCCFFLVARTRLLPFPRLGEMECYHEMSSAYGPERSAFEVSFVPSKVCILAWVTKSKPQVPCPSKGKSGLRWLFLWWLN